MNFPFIWYIVLRVVEVEGLFLALPCITALIYREESGWYFAAVMAACLIVGVVARKFFKPKSTVIFAKEGLVAVALCWVVASLVGALPFTLSGEIPSYVDALFEMISGFTTTGSSILTDVEALSYCARFCLFFAHWLGGMGILVFVMAIMPLGGSYSMYLMKAESPGPSVGKLVPKARHTAMLLYQIYIFLTVVMIALLLLMGMPLFDTLTITFGTAGTGGFAILNSSCADYTTLQQIIITVFMILFGINFNVYFLIYAKKVKQGLRCEEMRVYLGIIAAAIILISINTRGMFQSLFQTVQQVAFQVASIITTTGYATTNFDMWPEFSKMILVLLMFIGACAGSTGGGIKVSRFIILVKSVRNELFYALHPRSVHNIELEGHKVDKSMLCSIDRFFFVYIMIFALSVLIVSLDNFDFMTNFTAVATTLNNVGPGLSLVGPTGNFHMFSDLSKFVMMFDMLAGRLEVIPMMVLFSPFMWKK